MLKTVFTLILLLVNGSMAAASLFDSADPNFGRGTLRSGPGAISVFSLYSARPHTLRSNELVSIEFGKEFRPGVSTLVISRTNAGVVEKTVVTVDNAHIRRVKNVFYIAGSDMVPRQTLDIHGEISSRAASGHSQPFRLEKSCDAPVTNRIVFAGRERYCGERRMTAAESACRGTRVESGIQTLASQGISLFFFNSITQQEVARVQTEPVQVSRYARTSTSPCVARSEFDPNRPFNTTTR